jgi:N-succinyldiaminopimelate aminotransferase
LQTAAAFGLRLSTAYFAGLQSALQERRDLLVDGLKTVGFDVGNVSATYFAVAGAGAFDEHADDFEFCRRLTLEAGVTAVPISSFYGGRDVRSHIRFCFAKKRETLTSALSRLAAWRDGAGSTRGVLRRAGRPRRLLVRHRGDCRPSGRIAVTARHGDDDGRGTDSGIASDA